MEEQQIKKIRESDMDTWNPKRNFPIVDVFHCECGYCPKLSPVGEKWCLFHDAPYTELTWCGFHGVMKKPIQGVKITLSMSDGTTRTITNMIGDSPGHVSLTQVITKIEVV